ncbi:TIGR00341 family protein [Pyruvatibacter sp.]|uniref:TIGR00341 family protein n=1 Tax=Pyruvatibacter sp. TaxID=1981328 RepID=UPI0032EED095
MALQLVEVTSDHGHVDTLVALGEQQGALDVYADERGEMDRCLVRFVISTKRVQGLLDAIQAAIGAQENWRAVVLPIQASVPGPGPSVKSVSDDEPRKFSFGSITVSREAIWNEINKGARLDLNFIILSVLSTITAAIGLLTDNVAVVIGAMVIAPLLGPNLAFAFGTALGDRTLMARALGTNVLGVSIALALSYVIGALWTGPLDAPELTSRTVVGFESIALALAAGAAAVLSLTTGLSATLVGVMVAVALLPPAATLGIMLGAGNYYAAGSAALLLGVNIVCVNLVAQLVFVVKGIGPRTWAQKRASRPARYINAVSWFVLLVALMAGIWWARQSGGVAPDQGFEAPSTQVLSGE